MSSYVEVAVSASAQVLKGTGEGEKGDVIHKIIASVDTADANAAATITDGSNAILLVPPSSAIGVYTIDFSPGLVAQTGPWKITTGSAVTAIVIGDFT